MFQIDHYTVKLHAQDSTISLRTTFKMTSMLLPTPVLCHFLCIIAGLTFRCDCGFHADAVDWGCMWGLRIIQLKCCPLKIKTIMFTAIFLTSMHWPLRYMRSPYWLDLLCLFMPPSALAVSMLRQCLRLASSDLPINNLLYSSNQLILICVSIECLANPSVSSLMLIWIHSWTSCYPSLSLLCDRLSFCT